MFFRLHLSRSGSIVYVKMRDPSHLRTPAHSPAQQSVASAAASSLVALVAMLVAVAGAGVVYEALAVAATPVLAASVAAAVGFVLVVAVPVAGTVAVTGLAKRLESRRRDETTSVAESSGAELNPPEPTEAAQSD